MAEAEGDDAGEGHQGGQSQQRHGEALGLILDEAEQLRAGIAAEIAQRVDEAMPLAAGRRSGRRSAASRTRLGYAAVRTTALVSKEFAKRVNRRSMHAE
jgi:hypothetical protein